ncbi:MAG: Lrp/AsnC family transcriptional regulator [Chloroflexi bacterium]|nr:Lrp/AsnC family transcriptional regulator [Chloroflexota bacterium]
MIDKIDAKLLEIIQQNAHLANTVLAERVGLTKTAVFERIRKMEAAGIIQTYETRLNPKQVGVGQLAFIYVRAEDRPGDTKTGNMLAKIPQVLEVHHIAGEDCYLVKVRVKDTEALGNLLREKIGKIKSVRSTRTTIVFNTLKETACLPLDRLSEEQDE